MPKLDELSVNQALVDANGNFDAAAASLDVDVKAIHGAVNDSPALTARWSKQSSPPTSFSVLSRGDDLSIAKALAREEQMLAEGIEGFGLSERAKTLTLSCFRLQRKTGRMLMDLTGGGMVKAFIDALSEVEVINQRLDNLDVPEEQRLAYESILREDRGRLLDFIHKAAVKVDQSVLIQAKIQKMFRDDDKGGKSSRKPGFAPIKKVSSE